MRLSRSSLGRAGLYVIALLMPLAAAEAQSATSYHVQELSGRVTADSAGPIAGALVSVTMAPDRVFKQDTTDADGRWRVQFEPASGDYLVHVAALGHKAFRKRVTVSSDTTLIVDVTLARVVQQLAGIVVQAVRPKPSREAESLVPDGTSGEQMPDGVTGGVTADMQGDFAALAATVPGLAVTGSGISAFGLDPSLNSTTVNGMSFPGVALPRNARTTTRFTTSTYDPARGGFAGVETAVTLSPGGFNKRRTANLTLDAPQLQLTDRMGRLLGNRFGGVRASLGGSGALVDDRWYYNAAVDLSRSAATAPSILTADARLFPLAGVAADSVAHLLQAFDLLGIPATTAVTPTQRTNDDLSFALRVDHAPFKPQSALPNEKTWAMVGIGRFQRNNSQSAALTSTPSQGRRGDRSLGVLQFIYSTFVDEYSLSETKSALSASRTRSRPYLHLPEGSVLVSSFLPDGSARTSALTFGGNARGEVEESLLSWEVRSEYQWIRSFAHRLKLTGQSKLDRYRESAPGNALGRFSFSSIADLAANNPSAYSRTFDEPARSGSAWTGFASLGDQWRYSPTLQFVYGARLEANRFLSRPKYNPELDTALSVRTDVAPGHVHISPRFGFAWRFGGTTAGYKGVSVGQLGSQIVPPTGLLRGGIGEFRSVLPPHLLAGPSALTGLPSGARWLSCIGDAVPTPAWSAYLDDPTLAPDSCSNVPDSSFLEDRSPFVRTVDPSFDAPRSWRANLGLMTVVKSVGLTLDGSVSLNLNQPSITNANFRGAQQFILPDEGRPVYSSAAAIVPSTGLLSAIEARRSNAFGSVLVRKSDLRSLSRQLTAAVSSQNNLSSYMLRLAYTLSTTRGGLRGFDGRAFGDPRVVEQGRTDHDTRHRIQIQAAKSFPRGFSASMVLASASGLPYTPTVNGDVNGDGVGWDRAFITDPSRTSDPDLAAAMRELLGAAPARARECLARQLGRAANINSCEGPWATVATGRIGIANASGPWGRRINASLSLTNPLAAFDRALHGENHMHGWGASRMPDPILLTVKGFDPAAQRFRYEVNPRFGSTSMSQSTARLPFRITLDISFDLGPSPGRQQLERALNRGRAGRPGQKLGVDSIRIRFARNVPSPYVSVIREADSLLLSPGQVEQLRAANANWKANADSIWFLLGGELEGLADDYDAALATQKVENATDQVWELARLAIPVIKEILSPLQFSLAPGEIHYLANAKKGKIRIRLYSY